MFQSLRLMRCTRHSIRRQDGAMHQTLNSKAGNVRCIRQSQFSTRWCDAPDTQLEDKMVRCTILFQFATRWCDALDSQFSQRWCDALDSLTWKITQDKMVRYAPDSPNSMHPGVTTSGSYLGPRECQNQIQLANLCLHVV